MNTNREPTWPNAAYLAQLAEALEGAAADLRAITASEASLDAPEWERAWTATWAAYCRNNGHGDRPLEE